MTKNKRDKRHSGRTITKIYHPDIYPFEETKYDDWDNYRDGYRQLGRDKTKITPISNVQKDYKYRVYKSTDIVEANKKNKRAVKIRRTRIVKKGILGKFFRL
jgi:hypothetical protein